MGIEYLQGVMPADGMHYAVFGKPVAQSLSPFIQQAFAKQCDIPLICHKVETEPRCLKNDLARFQSQGGFFVNITSPLKERAVSLCQHLSESAGLIGAVNSLTWHAKDNGWYGDNTDGKGFIDYLMHFFPEMLQARHIVILGAGGAAKALVHAFLQYDVQSMTVLYRQANRVYNFPNDVRINLQTFAAFNHLPTSTPIDMIVNATSSSLYNQLVPLEERFIKGKIVIDLAYSIKGPTKFVSWAGCHGARKADDGLGMLVYQAAHSFESWFGVKSDPNIVFKLLQKRQRDGRVINA